MRLGNHIFVWEPDEISPVDRKKDASVVSTYTGAAHFQWGSVLAGVPIRLTWDLMQESEFQALRTKYDSTDQFEFNPDLGGVSYNVIVLDLQSKYIKTVRNEQPYRQNVTMVLSIVTQASTTTTTTTSSSTTTTTT